MSERIEFGCDIDDCYVCGVSAGRCEDCRVCDMFESFFSGTITPSVRCVDVCPCRPCSRRRRGARDRIGRDVDGTTGEVSGVG